MFYIRGLEFRSSCLLYSVILMILPPVKRKKDHSFDVRMKDLAVGRMGSEGSTGNSNYDVLLLLNRERSPKHSELTGF